MHNNTFSIRARGERGGVKRPSRNTKAYDLSQASERRSRVAAGMVVRVVVVVMMVVDRRLVGDLGGSVSSLRKVPPAKWALMLVLCTFL
jgi:hypothetical protein